MRKIAYLANQFPSAVEPYVSEEIAELQRRGISVIAGSVRTAVGASANAPTSEQVFSLQPVRVLTLLRALALMARGWQTMKKVFSRVLWHGQESPQRRLKALLHTWLGAYYAVLIRKQRVNHIHVHHGYFGAWIGMVAARLLGISYSLTLHGSDLLINESYLDEKIKNCSFCITVSAYNREYIISRFPKIDPGKVIVARLGVEFPEYAGDWRRRGSARPIFSLITVGRLHPVKDHAFLVRACARLRDDGIEFCLRDCRGWTRTTAFKSTDSGKQPSASGNAPWIRKPRASRFTLPDSGRGCAHQPQ